MSHSIPHRSRATVALITLLLVGAVGRAGDPAPGVTVIGGVADPPNKVAYLSDPVAGVVAVDIDSGKLKWESKEAACPVAALGKQIYALAAEKGKRNAFRVVTLDAGEKGKAVKKSDPVTLPDWADVGDANDRFLPPKTFHCKAELAGGSLTIRWQASSHPVRKFGFGEARIDLATGKVTTAPGKEIPFERPKHSDEVMRVIRKCNWNPGDPIVAAGDRVFGRFGGSKGDSWVLTLHVADLKTGEHLWERVIQEVRSAPEK